MMNLAREIDRISWLTFRDDGMDDAPDELIGEQEPEDKDLEEQDLGELDQDPQACQHEPDAMGIAYGMALIALVWLVWQIWQGM